jgi:N-hydroxyarylamine O-acetyltransferase
MQLERYFERVRWGGATTPTVDVLAGLLAHHMRAIPFENLDPLLGRPPSLEIDALEAKLVGARRGGYCYEHATLFGTVLRELGFEVRSHSARVVVITPRNESPRTHMFLTVGEHVLDPGFGRLAPRVPVPLDGTPAGDHRMVRDGADVALEAGAQRMWVSSLEHDLPIDFVMANHFTATHSRSPFTQHLLMRAFTDDGEVRLLDRDVTVLRAGEVQQKHVIADRVELRAFVATHFGFDLPEISTLRVPAVPGWE